jgi:hypothetical protein
VVYQILSPSFLLFFCRQFAGFSKQNRRFQETNPLISFNDSIDFVHQLQWIRSTISMDLFRHSAVFVAPICRFHRSLPVVLALLAVSSLIP